MANENGELNGEVVESGETPEARIERLEQNQAVMSILSDPDVRRVIEAKRAGKPLVLSETVIEPTPEPEEEDDLGIGKLPEDDPLKSTLQRISEVIDKKLASKNATIEKLLERLDAVEGVAGSYQKKEVVAQVNQVREKHRDFDQYQTSILSLSQKNPSLGVEELYVLAKLKAGKLNLNEGSTQSERPTSQPRRESTRKPGQPARPPGKKGFDEMLKEALGGLDVE
jgi:hypothetical protein